MVAFLTITKPSQNGVILIFSMSISCF